MPRVRVPFICTAHKHVKRIQSIQYSMLCECTWRLPVTSIKREKHGHRQFSLSDSGKSSVADEAAAIKSLWRAKKSLSRWQPHRTSAHRTSNWTRGENKHTSNFVAFDLIIIITVVLLVAIDMTHCATTHTHSRGYKEALQSGQVSNKSDCV